MSGVVRTAPGATTAKTPRFGNGVLPDHRRCPEGTGLKNIPSQGPGWSTISVRPARNGSSDCGGGCHPVGLCISGYSLAKQPGPIGCGQLWTNCPDVERKRTNCHRTTRRCHRLCPFGQIVHAWAALDILSRRGRRVRSLRRWPIYCDATEPPGHVTAWAALDKLSVGQTVRCDAGYFGQLSQAWAEGFSHPAAGLSLAPPRNDPDVSPAGRLWTNCPFRRGPLWTNCPGAGRKDSVLARLACNRAGGILQQSQRHPAGVAVAIRPSVCFVERGKRRGVQHDGERLVAVDGSTMTRKWFLACVVGATRRRRTLLPVRFGRGRLDSLGN
jgi:hypothetical protein